MSGTATGGINWASGRTSRLAMERKLMAEKEKQAGVSFPSASKQDYILIVRIDLRSDINGKIALARQGLRRLCSFLENLNQGATKIEVRNEEGDIDATPLKDYNFSATLGFGISFFEKLGIRLDRRPKKLYRMPDHEELGDPIPYVFTQTDLIMQLCSTKDFVNRLLFKTDIYPSTSANQMRKIPDQRKKGVSIGGQVHDISSALKGWAIVTDIHSGFQRLDGRNLMGFIDGISQPDRLNNNIVWTTSDDEEKTLTNGTYMVFQKIEHDLDLWETLTVREQEEMIGRSKETGLLLGTLTPEEDKRLAADCRSVNQQISNAAKFRLKLLLKGQRNPSTSFYNRSDPKHKNISLECPVWSHVRKANPRGADGQARKYIFRRGYLFMEDTIRPGQKVRSGLLFICFQRDIQNGFEYIKKHLLNNKNFPVPGVRDKFTPEELAYRRTHGRFSEMELFSLDSHQKSALGLNSKNFMKAVEESRSREIQNTGKEGLAGPSKLGVYPRGDLVATVTLGGGYYFVPPIPKQKISEIGQQFFD
jgi:Dyp-type peroxidase family